MTIFANNKIPGMTEVKFYDPDYCADENITYVVIGARYKGEWVFVKNRKRNAFEMPAGHIDKGEDAVSAAGRELYEESGSRAFVYRCINTYSVNSGAETKLWGKLFLADVSVLGEIVDRDEIEEICLGSSLPESQSFPGVLNILFERLKENCEFFNKL